MTSARGDQRAATQRRKSAVLLMARMRDVLLSNVCTLQGLAGCQRGAVTQACQTETKSRVCKRTDDDARTTGTKKKRHAKKRIRVVLVRDTV